MKRLLLLTLLIAAPAHAMDADDANAKCRVAVKSIVPDAVFGERGAAEVKPGEWRVIRVVRVRGVQRVFVCTIKDGQVVKIGAA